MPMYHVDSHDPDDLERHTTIFIVSTDTITDSDGVEYVLVFENRGSDVGVTLHHPHGQIYAYPFIPPKPKRALEAAARYRVDHDECLFCAVLDAELEDGRRITAAPSLHGSARLRLRPPGAASAGADGGE